MSETTVTNAPRYGGLTANEWIQLAGLGTSAVGAAKQNSQNQQNIAQDRFSNVNQRYGDALAGRGQFELDQFMQGENWRQNAAAQANQQTPFGTYQSAIQRNMLMSALLPGLIQANANRGQITPNNPAIAALMPKNTGLNFNPNMDVINQYFNPNAMAQRTAGSIAQQERANIGVNPFHQTVNAQELGLQQFAPMQNQLAGQAWEAQNRYQTGREQGLGMARQGLDQQIGVLADERKALAPKGYKIGEDGSLQKKPSKWKKVLGAMVKYGGMAAAIAFTGGAALPAVMAASSFAGDKIAGKSWKQAAIGAGMSAIPMGGGGVGAALGNKVGGQIANQTASKLANAGIQAGVRAVGDNVPYAGLGLSMANGRLGTGTAQTAANAAAPAFTGATNPRVWNNVLLKK